MCTSRQLRCALVSCVCVYACHAGGANLASAGPSESQHTGPTPPPSAVAGTTPPPYSVDRSAIEADMGTGGAAALGIPLCETTGFEANEPTCNWEAGYGICGSTFTCKNTATDGPYPTTCTPPLTQPDNCCVNAPNPTTGWYMEMDSQHCQEPHLSTAHPKTGSQHLRFQRSTVGGNPAGCPPQIAHFPIELAACRLSLFTPNANPNGPVTPFNPGVTITSFDVARDTIFSPGMEVLWSNQSITEGKIAQAVFIDYQGYVYALDFAYAGGFYVYMGVLDPPAYHHIRMVHDVCGDSVRYYFDGQLKHAATWSSGATQHVQSIEQSVWLADNRPGAIYDFDNFSVTRSFISEPACPSFCGNGIAEHPYEECEFGDDSCCPGQCNYKCDCPNPTNLLGSCRTRELVNGVNGPFYLDGGYYSYTADSYFTSIDTCGSDYNTQIFWDNVHSCSRDFAYFNDECFGETRGGTQSPGDPNAPCYGGPDQVMQSCLCVPTIPGRTYRFLVAEWAPPPAGSTFRARPCVNTIVNITKKTSCGLGGVIEGGACCDDLNGTCTDGVLAADCVGVGQVYSENKRCGMVDCESGACCNRAPGAGGACIETTMPFCPVSKYQSWLGGAECTPDYCQEISGACCDRAIGLCRDVIQGYCTCPLCSWSEGFACVQTGCDLALGACCVGSETPAECTEDRTLVECNNFGGQWSPYATCADIICLQDFVPIPTTSEWGLLVLALTLLVGGKVYWGAFASAARQVVRV